VGGGEIKRQKERKKKKQSGKKERKTKTIWQERKKDKNNLARGIFL
jgi:hypothetical protein